jgi:hypothetical protein
MVLCRGASGEDFFEAGNRYDLSVARCGATIRNRQSTGIEVVARMKAAAQAR